MKERLFVYGHISSIIGETGTVAQLTLSLLDLTLASFKTQARAGRGNMNRDGGRRINVLHCFKRLSSPTGALCVMMCHRRSWQLFEF